jgi:dynein light chain LC8-type
MFFSFYQAKYKTESEIAKYVKQEADTAYGPLWHCIVGKSFGSMVSHSPGDGFGGFIYLYVNNIVCFEHF